MKKVTWPYSYRQFLVVQWENHSTMFTKKAWQFKDNKNKEFGGPCPPISCKEMDK